MKILQLMSWILPPCCRVKNRTTLVTVALKKKHQLPDDERMPDTRTNIVPMKNRKANPTLVFLANCSLAITGTGRPITTRSDTTLNDALA